MNYKVRVWPGDGEPIRYEKHTGLPVFERYFFTCPTCNAGIALWEQPLFCGACGRDLRTPLTFREKFRYWLSWVGHISCMKRFPLGWVEGGGEQK